MPKMRAEADNGQELHVHIPQVLAWALSLASVAIVAGVALLINLNLRVTVIENTRFTAADAVQVMGDVVPRAEYEAVQSALAQRLIRMEDKLDRVLEGR